MDSISATGGCAALLVVLTCCWSAQVRADRAILLPVGGDAAETHGAEVATTLSALAAEVTLELIPDERVQAAAREGGIGECGDPTCIAPVLRALGAQMAIGVAVWMRRGVPRLTVVLVDPEGHQVSAASEDLDVPFAESVRDTFGSALASWSARAGRSVRITGSPEGATITLNRQILGAMPFSGSLPAGVHSIAVSAAGHRTERREVAVAIEPGTLEIRFDLASEEGSRGQDDRTWKLATGIPLLVVGVAIAAIGATEFARGDQCVHCDAGTSYPMRTLTTPDVGVNGALLGVGGALIAGGAVLTILGALP